MTPNEIDMLLRNSQGPRPELKPKKRTAVGQGIETLLRTTGSGLASAVKSLASVKPNYNIRNVA